MAQRVLRSIRECVDEYFRDRSPHELNISASDRALLIRSVAVVEDQISKFIFSIGNGNGNGAGDEEEAEEAEDGSLSHLSQLLTSGQLFSQVESALLAIKTVIEQEMSYDVLPRFLRSDDWMKMLEDHGESFMRAHGTLKKAVEMNFTPDDFKELIMDDSEFEFYYNLVAEDDAASWKLVGFDRQQNIMAFSSKRVLDYFPNVPQVVHGGSCAKYVGILPFSFEFCERYIFNATNLTKYDDNIPRVTTRQYLSPEQLRQQYPNKKIDPNRSCALLDYELNLGFPFGKRQSLQVVTGKYDPVRKEAITLGKSFYGYGVDSDTSSQEGSTGSTIQRNSTKKEMFIISAVILRKIDDERTLLSQLHIYNFSSTGANKLVGLIVFKRAKQMSRGVIKFLKKQQNEPLADFDMSDGLTRTYVDHKERTMRLELHGDDDTDLVESFDLSE